MACCVLPHPVHNYDAGYVRSSASAHIKGTALGPIGGLTAVIFTDVGQSAVMLVGCVVMLLVRLPPR